MNCSRAPVDRRKWPCWVKPDLTALFCIVVWWEVLTWELSLGRRILTSSLVDVAYDAVIVCTDDILSMEPQLINANELCLQFTVVIMWYYCVSLLTMYVNTCYVLTSSLYYCLHPNSKHYTYNFCLFTGSIAQSANLPVFNLLRGWFWGFSPRRGDTLHRWGWNLAWRRGPNLA